MLKPVSPFNAKSSGRQCFRLAVIEASGVELATIAADSGTAVVLARKLPSCATSSGWTAHRPAIETSAVDLVKLLPACVFVPGPGALAP